jgi:dynein heavy chain
LLIYKRCSQLSNWVNDLTTPKVVWLSGLFNPQSFLTAIMQSTARKMGWALDNITLVAEVTKKDRNGIESAAREGAYIDGLYLEGARWDTQSNTLQVSKLKDLYPKMPVMHIKAVQSDKSDPKTVYACPVYKTLDRGDSNYIFTVKLKTKIPPEKWILGGVALIGDVGQ